MRKPITILLTTLTLALPVANGVAAAQTTQKTTKKVVTKKVGGASYEADRWGAVQVILTVATTTTTVGGKTVVSRHFTDLGGSYSYHTSRSQYIMSQSLPQLRQEFLAAQSANIQLVSGATNTSDAFRLSLQSALLKASA
ncbi:MAG: FMN-binding protein [Actinomycetes bacterium]